MLTPAAGNGTGLRVYFFENLDFTLPHVDAFVGVGQLANPPGDGRQPVATG